MADNTLLLPIPAEDVSDGYHTFKELYEHRCLLWMLVLHSQREQAFKTRKNDKGEEWDGWFIAGLDSDYGQMTYHLPMALWDKLDVAEYERNIDYDGHTSSDVIHRMNKMIEDGYV